MTIRIERKSLLLVAIVPISLLVLSSTILGALGANFFYSPLLAQVFAANETSTNATSTNANRVNITLVEMLRQNISSVQKVPPQELKKLCEALLHLDFQSNNTIGVGSNSSNATGVDSSLLTQGDCNNIGQPQEGDVAKISWFKKYWKALDYFWKCNYTPSDTGRPGGSKSCWKD